MPIAFPPFKPCPCGSGRSYAACCQPAHAGRPPTTPEMLMRSRYSAYFLQDAAYVLATWHPDTRPTSLDLQDGTRYLGLKIHDAQADEVEFTVRLKLPSGEAGRFRERSRFVQVGGAWFYLDGELVNPKTS